MTERFFVVGSDVRIICWLISLWGDTLLGVKLKQLKLVQAQGHANAGERISSFSGVTLP